MEVKKDIKEWRINMRFWSKSDLENEGNVDIKVGLEESWCWGNMISFLNEDLSIYRICYCIVSNDFVMKVVIFFFYMDWVIRICSFCGFIILEI